MIINAELGIIQLREIIKNTYTNPHSDDDANSFEFWNFVNSISDFCIFMYIKISNITRIINNTSEMTIKHLVAFFNFFPPYIYTKYIIIF